MKTITTVPFCRNFLAVLALFTGLGAWSDVGRASTFDREAAGRLTEVYRAETENEMLVIQHLGPGAARIYVTNERSLEFFRVEKIREAGRHELVYELGRGRKVTIRSGFRGPNQAVLDLEFGKVGRGFWRLSSRDVNWAGVFSIIDQNTIPVKSFKDWKISVFRHRLFGRRIVAETERGIFVFKGRGRVSYVGQIAEPSKTFKVMGVDVDFEEVPNASFDAPALALELAACVPYLTK